MEGSGLVREEKGTDLLLFFEILDLGLVFSKNSVKVAEVRLRAIHPCGEVGLDSFDLRGQVGLKLVHTGFQSIESAVIEKYACQNR
jgi:hypothetical protein